jgi:hypothetical protein
MRLWSALLLLPSLLAPLWLCDCLWNRRALVCDCCDNTAVNDFLELIRSFTSASRLRAFARPDCDELGHSQGAGAVLEHVLLLEVLEVALVCCDVLVVMLATVDGGVKKSFNQSSSVLATVAVDWAVCMLLCEFDWELDCEDDCGTAGILLSLASSSSRSQAMAANNVDKLLPVPVGDSNRPTPPAFMQPYRDDINCCCCGYGEKGKSAYT